MTRRTGLMALFAVMGQMFSDDAAARQTVSSGFAGVSKWTAERLTVKLGDGGLKTFEFTDGTETVTFTATELMAALKEPR